MFNVQCYIGIDPGKETGMAAWDSSLKEFEELRSDDFWPIFQAVLRYPVETTVIYMENPNLISPTFPRNIKEKGKKRDAIMQKIGQKVGMNKRDAQLLLKGFEDNGYTVFQVKPTGRAGTKRKWNAETFMNFTKLDNGYNEHIRDAAMMVFGLPEVPMIRYKKLTA